MLRANFLSRLLIMSQAPKLRRAPLALASLLIGLAILSALLTPWEQKSEAQSKKSLEPCASKSGDKLTLKVGCEWKQISNSKFQAVEKRAGGATPRRYSYVEADCYCLNQGKFKDCPVVRSGSASIKCGQSPCDKACDMSIIIKDPQPQ